MKCERHPKYKGASLPKNQCPECQLVWAEKHRAEYPTCTDIEWEILKTQPPLKTNETEVLRRTAEVSFLHVFPHHTNKWLRTYKKVDKANMPAEKLVDMKVAAAVENLQLRDLKNENKALLTRLRDAELMIADLTALPMAERTPINVVKKVLRGGKVVPEAMPIAFIADWHAGKHIDFKKVMGRNRFDPDIFNQRLHVLGDSIVKTVRHIANTRPVNTVGIVSLGDLMENELRTESAATNTLMPFDEQFLVTGALDWLIDHVQTHTECHVKVHMEWGNHSRNTKKIEWGRIKETSYEYAIALELGRRFASHDKVTVDWSDSDQSVFDIFDTPIRTTHGFGINYKKNAGGISASGYTMLRGWNDGMARPPRYTFLGHFHHLTEPRGLYAVNCLCGYDSYAQGRGFPFSSPSQSMYVIDSKRGMTFKTELFLEAA